MAPTDIWSNPDEDAYVVIFTAEQTQVADAKAPPLQTFLAFMIDESTFAVRNASILAVDLEDDNWVISNRGLPSIGEPAAL